MWRWWGGGRCGGGRADVEVVGEGQMWRWGGRYGGGGVGGADVEVVVGGEGQMWRWWGTWTDVVSKPWSLRCGCHSYRVTVQ